MSNSKRANKKAKTSTERGQKRRKKNTFMKMKEVRFDISATEKELAKRVAKEMGYPNVTEYYRNETLKRGYKLGITCRDINREWAKAEEVNEA